MARITWLADVLRAAGCAVREDDTSWKSRGGSDFSPQGLIIHATAGGLAQGNDSAYNVLVHGREGLAGPISQVMVERGTGRWRPVCSGRSNHAKTGWAGNCAGLGNSRLIGIEYHHANTAAEPWTESMLDNYARGAAAICRHMGWGVNRIALHKEHQPGEKSDTTFDGNAFRARVQRFLTSAPTPQEEDMPLVFLVKHTGKDTVWLCREFMDCRPVTATGFPVLRTALASNSIGNTVWEWPDNPAYNELRGVDLASLDDPPVITPEQLAQLGLVVRQGVPTLDQIRAVVDEEAVSPEEMDGQPR